MHAEWKSIRLHGIQQANSYTLHRPKSSMTLLSTNIKINKSFFLDQEPANLRILLPTKNISTSSAILGIHHVLCVRLRCNDLWTILLKTSSTSNPFTSRNS